MAHLNGKQGTAIVWLAYVQRWQIKMDGAQTGGISVAAVRDGIIQVRPENLVLVALAATGVGEVVGNEIAVDEALTEELSQVKELRGVKLRRVNSSEEEDAGTDAVEALATSAATGALAASAEADAFATSTSDADVKKFDAAVAAAVAADVAASTTEPAADVAAQKHCRSEASPPPP